MTPEEREELFKKVSALATNEQQKLKDTIDTYIKSASINDITKVILDNIGAFTFQLPEIVLPKIEFPKIEIDYERIKKITNDNAKYGWTLTGEIDFSAYFKDELLYISLEQKDKHFYNYYSKNDWQHYHHMKDSIMKSIDRKWLDVLEDCFDSFEQDKYKGIIPTLFSIIEGETAFIYQTDEVGKGLIRYMDSKTKNEKHHLTKITIYSLIHCMRRQLFVYHGFNKQRKGVINRNWVLHGRDNPEYWQKVDALRLINILSTVQLVKKYKDS